MWRKDKINKKWYCIIHRRCHIIKAWTKMKFLSQKRWYSQYINCNEDIRPLSSSQWISSGCLWVWHSLISGALSSFFPTKEVQVGWTCSGKGIAWKTDSLKLDGLSKPDIFQSRHMSKMSKPLSTRRISWQKEKYGTKKAASSNEEFVMLYLSCQETSIILLSPIQIKLLWPSNFNITHHKTNSHCCSHYALAFIKWKTYY